MKIVINKCFGGFGLSPLAVKRIADLQGRECYFFTNRGPDGELDFGKHHPVSMEQAAKERHMWSAFDIPNPDETLLSQENWHSMTDEEKQASNEDYDNHSIDHRDIKRDDHFLIQVVEELGEAANSHFAELKVVEIPDGVDWEIDEYDGSEHIAEKHRTWG